MKRAIAMLLAICMILCQMPLPARAAEPEPSTQTDTSHSWMGFTNGAFPSDSSILSSGLSDTDAGLEGLLPVSETADTLNSLETALTALTVGGVDALANPSGDGWSFDAATATLTLAGATIDAGGADFAIHAEGALNILLAEGTENRITGFNVIGIHVMGALNIQGEHLYIASDAANTLGIGADVCVEIMNCANLETETTGAGISTNQTITIDSSTVVIRNSIAGVCAPGQITITDSHVTSVTDITLDEVMASGSSAPPAGIYSETALAISHSELNIKAPMFAIIADVNETQVVIEDSTIHAEASYGGIASMVSTSITGSDITIDITMPLEDAMALGLTAPPDGILVFQEGGTLTISDSSIEVNNALYAIVGAAGRIEGSDIDIENCYFGIIVNNSLELENCGHIRVASGTELIEQALELQIPIEYPPVGIFSLDGRTAISNCGDVQAESYMAGILSNVSELSISNSTVTAYGGIYGIGGATVSIDDCNISAHGTWSEEQMIAMVGVSHAYAIAAIEELSFTSCTSPLEFVIDQDPQTHYYLTLLDTQGNILSDVALYSITNSGDAYQNQLEVLSIPTTCCVGEELNLDELIVAVVFPDGTRQLISSSLLTLSGFDSATSGMKEVTGTYNGMSVTFTVPVHEGHTTEEIPSAFYPESDHNYLDNLNDTQTLTWPGAFRLMLTFSPMTELESGFDRLYVCDGNDNEIACFTGIEAAGVSLEIPGDTVKLRLETDGSVNFYGYSFDTITAETLLHTGQVLSEATDSTCSVPGTTQVILCDICGSQVGGHELPLADHEYESVVTEATPESNGYTTHTCIHCGDSYTDSITVYGAIDCGSCGENVYWALTEDYELVIFGQGEMYDYDWEAAPWYAYREQITTVTVEEGITRIGRYAFLYCHSITDITLPSTLETIGEEAFRDCTGLTVIDLPDNVHSLGSHVFFQCSNLETITLPANLTCIPRDAFYGCVSLRDITVPANVSAIEDNPFALCHNLTEIRVEDGNENFCSLDGVLYSFDQTQLVAYPGGKTGSYTIPDQVTHLGSYCFQYAAYLTSAELPAHLESIGTGIFYGCGVLESVHIPDTVTTLGMDMFNGCTSLREVNLPSGITSIPGGAFCGCSSLDSIVIPDGVTTIEGSAFSNCTMLTDLELPDQLTGIQSGAFENCSRLTQLVIPASVTYMDCAPVAAI